MYILTNILMDNAKIFILATFIAKTLHKLSKLLKNVRKQDLQVNQIRPDRFERPKRSIRCMNYWKILGMVLMTAQGMNLKLIIHILMLLVNFQLCQENIFVLILEKTMKASRSLSKTVFKLF